MPAIDTGDILHWTSGAGHIGLALDGNRVIHAQMKGNFHIDTDQQANGGQMAEVFEKEEQAVRVVAFSSPALNEAIQRYSPEAIDTYTQRGGKVTKDAVKTLSAPAAGGWKIERLD